MEDIDPVDDAELEIDRDERGEPVTVGGVLIEGEGIVETVVDRDFKNDTD